MDINFTARYARDGEWWIVWAEEIPGAISQGKTLEEARWMIKDAVQSLVHSYREERREMLGGDGHVDAVPPEVLTVGDDEIIPPQPTVQEYLDSPDYQEDLAEFGREVVGPATQTRGDAARPAREGVDEAA